MFIPKTSEEESNANVPLLQNKGLPPCVPIRYIIVFMCCAANALNFSMRMNWSVSILSMVRHPTKSYLQKSNSSLPTYSDTVAGDFDWDMESKQIVLGAFYYGYTVTPVLGGWLVGKYGGYPVLLIAVMMCSLTSLSTPFVAKLNLGVLILNRVIDGFFQGLVFSSTLGIVAKWSKVCERSTFVSISTSGYSIGAILSSYISTWICTSPFLGGWPTTFYTLGVCCIMWSFVWSIIGSSDVTNNRWISEFEKKFIEAQSSKMQREQVTTVSWYKMVKSRPVWAITVACIGMDLGYFLLLTDIPIFLNTILKFNVKTSGLLSAATQLAYLIVSICGGIASDTIISRGILSVTLTRKIFVSFVLGIISFLLVLIGYISYRVMAVVFMIVSFSLYGLTVSAICVNAVDISPEHSALVIGIAYTISGFTGFVGPSVVGALTHISNTIIQWSKVFWIIASVQIVGLISFLIFGSGEIQDLEKTSVRNANTEIEGFSAKEVNTEKTASVDTEH